MLPTAALQDHEHARGCDAAIAADNPRRRVPRHRTGGCRADQAIGVRRQGDVAAVIETFITPAVLWILG